MTISRKTSFRRLKTAILSRMPRSCLISFILGYGAHAKVLEPKALADAVCRELEKMSALYKT